MVVMGDIEEQGWMELARALRSRLDDYVIIEKLFCSRETIQKAKQDDFKVTWDRTIISVIPATGVSNGMAGGADLILQGNTLLHTARRGSTPRRWCCPCAR